MCAFDGAVGACHKKCATVADCRGSEGYQCKPASTDPNAIATHAYCDVKDDTFDMATPADGGGAGG